MNFASRSGESPAEVEEDLERRWRRTDRKTESCRVAMPFHVAGLFYGEPQRPIAASVGMISESVWT